MIQLAYKSVMASAFCSCACAVGLPVASPCMGGDIPSELPADNVGYDQDVVFGTLDYPELTLDKNLHFLHDCVV